MDHLVRLQLSSLLKKYDYLCGELEVKSEISAISQGVFWENVERVMRGDDTIIDAARPLSAATRSEDPRPAPDPVESDRQGIDEDVRAIYRAVAKITHPDKVRNDYLNGLYVEATRMARENDRVGMYGLAIRLGIEVGLPDSLHDDLLGRIAEMEAKIRFLESSYHMRWYYSDRQAKIELLCEYIERNMLRLSEA